MPTAERIQTLRALHRDVHDHDVASWDAQIVQLERLDLWTDEGLDTVIASMRAAQLMRRLGESVRGAGAALQNASVAPVDGVHYLSSDAGRFGHSGIYRVAPQRLRRYEQAERDDPRRRRIVRELRIAPDGHHRWVSTRRRIGDFTEATLATTEVATQVGEAHGFCLNCGRTLTVPQSIERGIGPVCWRRLQAQTQRRAEYLAAHQPHNASGLALHGPWATGGAMAFHGQHGDGHVVTEFNGSGAVVNTRLVWQEDRTNDTMNEQEAQ